MPGKNLRVHRRPQSHNVQQKGMIGLISWKGARFSHKKIFQLFSTIWPGTCFYPWIGQLRFATAFEATNCGWVGFCVYGDMIFSAQKNSKSHKTKTTSAFYLQNRFGLKFLKDAFGNRIFLNILALVACHLSAINYQSLRIVPFSTEVTRLTRSDIRDFSSLVVSFQTPEEERQNITMFTRIAFCSLDSARFRLHATQCDGKRNFHRSIGLLQKLNFSFEITYLL